MAKRYHLCCGPDVRKGWINVDQGKFGQEIQANIEQPWTWAENGEADYIFIKDGFEHLTDLSAFLERAAKALKKGGTLEIHVPHYKSPSAYRLTHQHYFSWNTFSVFPEAHDSVQTLRVTQNKLIIDPVLGPLNGIANVFPRFFEKIVPYLSGIRVKMTKK